MCSVWKCSPINQVITFKANYVVWLFQQRNVCSHVFIGSVSQVILRMKYGYSDKEHCVSWKTDKIRFFTIVKQYYTDTWVFVKLFFCRYRKIVRIWSLLCITFIIVTKLNRPLPKATTDSFIYHIIDLNVLFVFHFRPYISTCYEPLGIKSSKSRRKIHFVTSLPFSILLMTIHKVDARKIAYLGLKVSNYRENWTLFNPQHLY